MEHLMEHVIKELSRDSRVVSILQFGSSLKKKAYRDIDLCLFTSRRLVLKDKLQLQRRLPERVDVSFYDDLPLHLKKVVLSEGKILFTRDYYKLLKEIQYVDLEYPRYAQFLEDYHENKMESVS